MPPIPNAPRVLIAEDDPSLRELLREILSDGGFAVSAVGDGAAAMAALARGGVDAVLSDVNMPHADGLAVVQAARALRPAPPVILLTGFGSIAGAVEAMRAGAFDYLSKPVRSPAALRTLLGRAIESARASARGEDAAHVAAEAPGDAFIAADPESRKLLELVDRLAARDITVLLQGESGVGKEVVARRIHERSPRRGGRFLAVNCGAIPRELFEGQMFGHAKGAFSGAQTARRGFFEDASGGTLLLDEIGELPLGLQVKLLRVLEERRVTRLGETHDVPVDVRVVAATNRDLAGEVAAGAFRQDLYFRLSVFPLAIRPLRERRADILPLAEAILRRAGEGRRVITEEARRALSEWSWPGNVRELRNVIERAVVLAGDEPIAPSHLGLRAEPARAGRSNGPASPTSLEELERQAILDALEATGGNRKQAAARLGVALRTLQYKLKEYGLIRR